MTKKQISFKNLKTRWNSHVSRAVLEAAWEARPEPIEVYVARKKAGMGGWMRDAWVEYFRLSLDDHSEMLEWFASKSEFELQKSHPEAWRIYCDLHGSEAYVFLNNCLVCGIDRAMAARERKRGSHETRTKNH